jgi:hypothetical protein
MNNQDAIRHLFLNDLINHSTFKALIKKDERLKAKQAKEVRQSAVNEVVGEHLESLEPGNLFKHRTVWEAVGREEFTRDEVLKALQAFKASGLVEQVRKGPNNFQVFWARCGTESAEPEVEAK